MEAEKRSMVALWQWQWLLLLVVVTAAPRPPKLMSLSTVLISKSPWHYGNGGSSCN